MPRRGMVRVSDLIEKVIAELGGEAEISVIYERFFQLPEAQEKIEARGPSGNPVKIKSQIRERLQRSGQFVPGERKGLWKLANRSPIPKPKTTVSQFSLPAKYFDRAIDLLVIMHDSPVKTEDFGWAQRELAKAMQIDINAVNKLVNFMSVEGILYLKGGTGRTYDPFRYSPCNGIMKSLEDFKNGRTSNLFLRRNN